MDEMRPEYDIRGGVRGKYFAQFHGILFEESPFVWISTASTPDVGAIVKSATYPPAYPSPKIEGISPIAGSVT
jgi:hypothetical protein